MKKSEFKNIVREEVRRVLVEQSKVYRADEVREKINHILDNFDLPSDARELLDGLRDELNGREEISRREIDRILKSPGVRRKAANVDYHDFVTWVLER